MKRTILNRKILIIVLAFANFRQVYSNTFSTTCVSSDYGQCDSAGQLNCFFGWINPSNLCRTPHPCRTCICQNGGTCVPQGTDDYRCQCSTGYSGNNCETCAAGTCSISIHNITTCDICTICQSSCSNILRNISVAVSLGIIGGILLIVLLGAKKATKVEEAPNANAGMAAIFGLSLEFGSFDLGIEAMN